MLAILREVQQFASATEHLLAMLHKTILSDEERGLVHYYIRKLERQLELTHRENGES